MSALLILFFLRSCYSAAIQSFVINPSSTASDGGNLITTLNWNDMSYECTFTPTTLNALTCDNSIWTATAITPDAYVPFGFKLSWAENTAPFIFDEILITNDVAETFTITDFCIASTMQYTFDTALSTVGVTACAQYPSKDSYDELQIGGDTKLNSFYIDLGRGIEDQPNTAQEGAIRPPKISYISVTQSSASASPAANLDLFAQWDNQLYHCRITTTPIDPNEAFACPVVATQPICPGLASRFWISAYNPLGANGDIWDIGAIGVTDEMNNNYTMAQFCQPALLGAISGTNCVDFSSLIDVTAAYSGAQVGGNRDTQIAFAQPDPLQNLIAFLVDDQMFDRVNTPSPTVEIELVHAGSNDFSVSDFGWEVSQYGTPDNLIPECPQTLAPTAAPTTSPSDAPTISPSDNPTTDPTNVPTLNPSMEPTVNPTDDPTEEPTVDPTREPTDDPTTGTPTVQPTPLPTLEPTVTVNPTTNPSPNPTRSPTNDPSMEPTAFPTSLAPSNNPSKDPSFDPSKSPSEIPSHFPTASPNVGDEQNEDSDGVTANVLFWAIMALAIFFLCCLLCIILVWVRRNKEEEEEQEKGTNALIANSEQKADEEDGATDRYTLKDEAEEDEEKADVEMVTKGGPDDDDAAQPMTATDAGGDDAEDNV